VKITVILLATACLIAGIVTYVLSDRKGHEVNIEIPGLGLFEGQHFESDGKLYCYLCKKQFKNRMVDIVIYPKEDGAAYTAKDKSVILSRYELYVDKFDSAINASPELIRSKSKEYGNDNKFTDNEIIKQIQVDNIKIEWDGGYESYCNAGKIDENHDLVLRFNNLMSLIEVGFDG